MNGVDRTTLTLLRALRTAGHDVCAVVPEPGDVTSALDALEVTYWISPLGCCRGPARRAELRFLARAAERSVEIQNIIQDQRPDLVHLNTGHMIDAAIAAARTNTPALWHIHAPFAIDFQRYESFMTPDAYAWMLQQLGQHVIAVSDDVRTSIAAHLSDERISTLFNGIDVGDLDARATTHPASIHAELGVSEKDPIVFGVGRISAQKNFASFVRVARMVIDALPDTRFAIVGPGEERALAEELPVLIRDLGLQRHVYLLGPRADVPAMLTQGRAFLSTAIFEGQGLAALEAMALRLPVVAMSCVGLRECIQSGTDGVLVPLGDEAACAQSLIEVLQHPDAAMDMGARARRSVIENFSAAAYASSFTEIVERTIAFSGAHPYASGAANFALGMLNECSMAERMLARLETPGGFRASATRWLRKRLSRSNA